MAQNIILLGVLFLGGFIGFILAFALNFPKTRNVKIIATVIGTVFGSAPIAFMSGLTYEKWMYPIGLVLGFFWIRVMNARDQVVFAEKPFLKAFAWIDMLAIVGFTVIVIILAAIVK